MTTLDEIQARADAATEGPWQALGTGAANGDHWYICDADQAIAYVSAQDGINEDQREPDAEFIAHAREDVPKLVAALRAVERLGRHIDETHAELPKPHGPLTQGYAMAIRDVRGAIQQALDG